MAFCIFRGWEELDDDGEETGAYEYAFYEHSEASPEDTMDAVS